MNYYINFVPNDDKFIEKLQDNIYAEDIILNLYIKELPAMNINKNLYIDVEKSLEIIPKLIEQNFKTNIMFDTYCFGNKEFTEKGKYIFNVLDELLKLNIYSITLTNNFFFNYIKRRHKECKIIMSEYCDINDVQKICRYLEDLKADAVKLDVKLAKDIKTMKYISENFNNDSIHIDANKIIYENDILRDSLNNSLSHYIQEENWDKINELMNSYVKKQETLNNKKIYLNNNELEQLKQIGFKNFWY